MKIIGLMSGSSLDGLDVSLCDIKKKMIVFPLNSSPAVVFPMMTPGLKS